MKSSMSKIALQKIPHIYRIFIWHGNIPRGISRGIENNDIELLSGNKRELFFLLNDVITSDTCRYVHLFLSTERGHNS